MQMKKDDFVTTTEKMIEERRNATARIREEITGLEVEISDLQTKIEAYTDINNVKAYGDLKNNLEIRQHKLNALKRDLAAKLSGDDGSKTLIILNGFISEKRRIDDEYADEMLEIIRQLDAKLREAEEQRNSLKALYDSWITLFKVDTNKYQGYPLQDETGVSFNAQKLVNTLRGTGKLL